MKNEFFGVKSERPVAIGAEVERVLDQKNWAAVRDRGVGGEKLVGEDDGGLHEARNTGVWGCQKGFFNRKDAKIFKFLCFAAWGLNAEARRSQRFFYGPEEWRLSLRGLGSDATGDGWRSQARLHLARLKAVSSKLKAAAEGCLGPVAALDELCVGFGGFG